MRIGKLAKASGTSVQAIRFYERCGLLGKPVRLGSGYRNFSDETVRVVRYIKQSQELGFTLAEIKELLSLRRNPADNSAEVRALAGSKLSGVEKKIAALGRIRDELKHILKSCECSDKSRCPALEALDFTIP